MKIEKLDNQGRGITYFNNKIGFISNALENEEVDVLITLEKKKYFNGYATNIKNISNNRVRPICPYYNLCGGCNLMHLKKQSLFKINKVKDIIKKYTSINPDIEFITSDKSIGYRNKISLKIENYKWGYYNASSHSFVSIDKCLLASDAINDIIKNKENFNIENGNITIRSNINNEILVIITSNKKVTINKMNSNIKGIILNNEIIYKDDYFIDEVGNFKFKVSYMSFFQINRDINKKIFSILKYNLYGNNLLDLYCGVGSLGISLKDNFKSIYGIESLECAIKDAIYNAKLNNVINSHYYVGDTASILANLNVLFDAIIIDPPRSGLNKKTLELILNILPKQICYISCEVLTLARDLKEILNYYDINKFYVLDMFPNTSHVECVCVLNRR